MHSQACLHEDRPKRQCNYLRVQYAGLFDEVEDRDLSAFCAQDPSKFPISFLNVRNL